MRTEFIEKDEFKFSHVSVFPQRPSALQHPVAQEVPLGFVVAL